MIKLPVMARYLDGSILVAKAPSLRGPGDAVNYGITATTFECRAQFLGLERVRLRKGARRSVAAAEDQVFR